MATVNFNLKNANAKNKTAINLVFYFDNQRFKIATGLSILPNQWNANNQRARDLVEFPYLAAINDKLEAFSRSILKIYHHYQINEQVPELEDIKRELFEQDDSTNKRKDFKINFWNSFENFISFKKKQLTDVRDYDKSLRKHLLAVEKLLKNKLSYSIIKNVSSTFVETFDNYLTYIAINAKGEKGLSTNTIGKQYKNLKVFLNWSFDRDVIPRFSIKHLITKTEEVDNIYLTEAELKSLEKLVLNDPNEKIVRDLFLIGCETALRFSDYNRLKEEHIRTDEIHIRPKKTEGSGGSNKVVIPISSRLQRVLDKYKNIPPTFQSGNITLFNKSLREICEKAGINDYVIQVKKIAGKTIETKIKKFELVTSHTCRRTFCTLKFLDKMPSHIIMKFSGHKTERAFMRYLKIDAEMAAKQYKDFFK